MQETDVADGQHSSTPSMREHSQLETVRRRLRYEFGQTVPSAEIDLLVSEVLSTFHDARVRMYLPILVERLARTRLQQWDEADRNGLTSPSGAFEIYAQTDPRGVVTPL